MTWLLTKYIHKFKRQICVEIVLESWLYIIKAEFKPTEWRFIYFWNMQNSCSVNPVIWQCVRWLKMHCWCVCEPSVKIQLRKQTITMKHNNQPTNKTNPARLKTELFWAYYHSRMRKKWKSIYLSSIHPPVRLAVRPPISLSAFREHKQSKSVLVWQSKVLFDFGLPKSCCVRYKQ